MNIEIKTNDIVNLFKDDSNWDWENTYIDKLFYRDCESMYCDGGYDTVKEDECEGCRGTGQSDKLTLFGERLLEFIRKELIQNEVSA